MSGIRNAQSNQDSEAAGILMGGNDGSRNPLESKGAVAILLEEK